jgi:SAM-dependent methyltransferase
VRRYAQLIPLPGAVLDLASGSGRHAQYLAMLGYQVLAVDQNIESLPVHPLITPRQLDLEQVEWPLEGHLFQGIVVTNYLYRPHLDRLPKLLSKDGVLIYETFAQGNAQFGKPSNPNFLLKTGELLDFSLRNALKVVAYEDIYLDKPKPAMMQRICAVKTG